MIDPAAPVEAFTVIVTVLEVTADEVDLQEALDTILTEIWFPFARPVVV